VPAKPELPKFRFKSKHETIERPII
jgi:hypothetical protein